MVVEQGRERGAKAKKSSPARDRSSLVSHRNVCVHVKYLSCFRNSCRFDICLCMLSCSFWAVMLKNNISQRDRGFSKRSAASGPNAVERMGNIFYIYFLQKYFCDSSPQSEWEYENRNCRISFRYHHVAFNLAKGRENVRSFSPVTVKAKVRALSPSPKMVKCVCVCSPWWFRYMIFVYTYIRTYIRAHRVIRYVCVCTFAQISTTGWDPSRFCRVMCNAHTLRSCRVVSHVL